MVSPVPFMFILSKYSIPHFKTIENSRRVRSGYFQRKKYFYNFLTLCPKQTRRAFQIVKQKPPGSSCEPTGGKNAFQKALS
jgi:hypothetical protein